MDIVPSSFRIGSIFFASWPAALTITVPVSYAFSCPTQRPAASSQPNSFLLDLTGDPKVVGKSLGKDLEKGKLTLPLIRRLETAGPADRQQLVDLLRSNDDGRFERIGEMLSASNSVDYAHQRAVRLIAVAKSAVVQLPESLARSTLNAMADGVVTREF